MEGRMAKRLSRLSGWLLVGLMFVGCGAAPPSASAPQSPISLPTAAFSSPSPSATPLATLTPVAPTPSPTPHPELTDLELEFYQVPPRYTQGMSELRSLGNEIIWAASDPPAADGHPTLYRYRPGDAEPEIIYRYPEPYRAPMRKFNFGWLAGSERGYVYSTYRTTRFGYGAWWVWYVSAPGAEPVLLDHSAEEGDIAPMVDINDRYIAWTPGRGPWLDKVSQVRFVRVDDLAHPVTLKSSQHGFAYHPALHGDELWYGWSEHNPDTGIDATQIEMIDLTRPSVAPTIFGAGTGAAMPAVGDSVVVWKTTDPKLASLSSGVLAVYWRETGTVDSLPLPGGRPDFGVSYPSVGHRFVAWLDDIRTRFYLYDLAEHRFRRVAEWRSGGNEGVVKKSVKDNLLAVWYYPDQKHHFLRWAWLPD
jgi:hypothetical protein